jgi:hypothetical protein
LEATDRAAGVGGGLDAWTRGAASTRTITSSSSPSRTATVLESSCLARPMAGARCTPRARCSPVASPGCGDLDRRRVTLILRADAVARTVAAFYVPWTAAACSTSRRSCRRRSSLPAAPGWIRVLRRGGWRACPRGIVSRLGMGPLEYRFEHFQVACHDECGGSAVDPGPGGRAENVIEPNSEEEGRERSAGGAKASR